MTKQIEDDVPAFPRNYSANGHNGMWLRDYFAGQALAGDMANSSEGCFSNNAETDDLQSRAKFFYRMADAMLAARKGDAS